MRRGRPPYPDVLTPREQEVLALIRDGLTNEQIAARLGISESGARYHVSEILSKLGVASRHEAAQWVGEVAGQRRFRLSMPQLSPMLLAGGAVATGVVAFVGLAVGVLIMGAREDEPQNPQSTPTSTYVIGEEALQLQSKLFWMADSMYLMTRSMQADSAFCGVCDLPEQSSFDIYCGKELGDDVKLHPGYDPNIHEPLASLLTASCARLSSSLPRSDFLLNARIITAELEPTVVAHRQNLQPSSAGVPSPRPPMAPAGFYPVGTHTGLSAIDRTLDLIYTSDWAGITAEAVFQNTPCTYIAFGIGIFTCHPGELEGSIHRTMSIGGCEPGPSEPPGVQASLQRFSDAFLVAAFEVVDGVVAQEHRYTLLFSSSTSLGQEVQLALDDDGHMVWMGSCGKAEHIPGSSYETILPRLP